MFCITGSCNNRIIISSQRHQYTHFQCFSNSDIHTAPLSILRYIQILESNIQIFQYFLVKDSNTRLVSFCYYRLGRSIRIMGRRTICLDNHKQAKSTQSMNLRYQLVLFFLMCNRSFLYILNSQICNIQSLIKIFPILGIPTIRDHERIVINHSLFIRPTDTIGCISRQIRSTISKLIQTFCQITIPLIDTQDK